MEEYYVNARFLTQPISGVQRFALAVGKELRKRSSKIRFVAPAKVIHVNAAKELRAEKAGIFNGHLWEQFDLVRFLRKKNNPFLLSLCNTGPVNYGYQAVVIHDIASVKFPRFYSKKFAWWYKYLTPRLIKSAKLILTVSQFSCNEISNQWPLQAKKCYVAGNGISPGLISTDAEMERMEEGPFFLCFGGNNARKNSTAVIEAMKSSLLEKFKLVLVEEFNGNFRGKNKGHSFRDEGRIEVRAGITDSELSGLYMNAEALIYPSVYEGFGLPPLEAIYFNCPSLLSDIPVFREIYNGAALFIEDNSPNGIALAMKKLSEDKNLRSQLLERRKELLEIHTIRNTVDRMLSRLNWNI